MILGMIGKSEKLTHSFVYTFRLQNIFIYTIETFLEYLLVFFCHIPLQQT